MTRTFKRSPIALAVLALLHEAPMHPYRMQRLIKDRGKDLVINVEQRASLYQTIGQLLRAGLIAAGETDRQEGFPERMVYKLTEQGHHMAVIWLRDMLSSPAQEFPEFPAAISLLPLLTPADALQQMERREAKLIGQLAHLDEEVQSAGAGLPRLFLLETEYMQVMLQTELTWVRAIIADLQSGQLMWHQEWMQPTVPPAPGESAENTDAEA